jgi:hypothetical protein
MSLSTFLADQFPPGMLRRRILPVALVLAGAGAGLLLLPELPREHRVTLRLSEPASVTGLELAWSALGSPEAVRASSFTYAPGHAPRTVETRVSLPRGRYEVDILVERAALHEEFHRTVELGDADSITLPLVGTR